MILCGGLGTRIEPISKGLPKILMPIGKKTFLQVQLEKYSSEGVEEFIYILGHNNNLVEEAILDIKKTYPKLKIQILFEGRKRLGTGGAIKKFINALPENFLLTYGDNYLNIKIANLVSSFVSSGLSKNFLSIFKNENFLEPSNIAYDENHHKIMKYSKIDRKDMRHIDYGMSIWKKSFIESLDIKDEVFDFSFYINTALKYEVLDPFIVEERFYEIGTPESYEEFKNYYLGNV